jgi:predicted RNA-binding protein Jag
MSLCHKKKRADFIKREINNYVQHVNYRLDLESCLFVSKEWKKEEEEIHSNNIVNISLKFISSIDSYWNKIVNLSFRLNLIKKKRIKLNLNVALNYFSNKMQQLISNALEPKMNKIIISLSFQCVDVWCNKQIK